MLTDKTSVNPAGCLQDSDTLDCEVFDSVCKRRFAAHAFDDLCRKLLDADADRDRAGLEV